MLPDISADPTLCVVICCFTADRRRLLDRAIAGAGAQLGAGDALVVVVDHNDDLLRDLRDTGTGRATVLPNSHARGLSGARNTGLAAASHDVVVFLDDDAAPEPGALDAVRARFRRSGVIAVGGAVDAEWTDGAPGWFPAEFGWVVGCDYRGLPTCGGEIRNPIGAAMAVRREPLTAIGGFSPRLGRRGSFPAGCEETLMGIALRRAHPGAVIVRDTRFRVRHTVSAERGTATYFTRRCYQEGRSKAVLARLSTTGEALSSERSYTTRILPTGLWHARTRPLRALALILGFVCTAAGFGAGTITATRSSHPNHQSYQDAA